MQKFIVGNGIGGFKLTKAAAMYLDSVCFGFGEPDDTSEYAGTCWAMNNITKQFAKECCDEGDETKSLFQQFIELEMDDGIYSCSDEMKNRLMPAIEKLTDFHKLDEYNYGSKIRIVEVPDGANVFVNEDSETGCQWVQEVSRSWNSGYDWAILAKAKIRKACEEYRYDKDNCVFEKDDVKYAFNENYGVAKFRKCYWEITYNGDNVYRETDEWYYVFLRKIEYYRATEAHPKESYQIDDIESEGSFFSAGKSFYKPQEEVKSYIELIGKLL